VLKVAYSLFSFNNNTLAVAAVELQTNDMIAVTDKEMKTDSAELIAVGWML